MKNRKSGRSPRAFCFSGCLLVPRLSSPWLAGSAEAACPSVPPRSLLHGLQAPEDPGKADSEAPFLQVRGTHSCVPDSRHSSPHLASPDYDCFDSSISLFSAFTSLHPSLYLPCSDGHTEARFTHVRTRQYVA